MKCKYGEICGGCSFLELEEKEYQAQKLSNFKKIISECAQKDISLDVPIFYKEEKA